MAIIDKKLIHFTNLTTFEERLNAGDIKGTSIVFIQDAKQIWTHNEFYSCPFTEEEIRQLLIGGNITLDGYTEIVSPIGILATDTVNEAFGKLEDYINSMSELNAILVNTDGVADDPEVNDYITSTQLENSLLNKQDKLVSGTNIKTVNGESILGSGDIVIESAYAEMNHGTSDITFALTPNTFHVWDEVASLDLSFAEGTVGVANEYLFQFTSGATATSLTVPNTIEWVYGIPTIEANKTYQVSIVNNIGLIVGV